ncbi:hypothetical protein BVY03_03705, partial [bacterium K02(2017)]
HGHEDHLGALPYFLQKYQLPIYATDFTQGLIGLKTKEFGFKDLDIRDLHCKEPVQIGDINITPLFINHSIMDAVALHIQAHDLNILHCTDFKIDRNAPNGDCIDLESFKKLGDAGLDLLMSDSTNSMSPGHTDSETLVAENLLKLFKTIKGRIVVCLFSSNTYRQQSLIDCARATGRKIALTGRSSKEYFEVAKERGKLNLKDVEVYDVEDLKDFEDHEVLVLTTGSQAEPRSVLSRISQEMFKPFRIKEGDTLIMSSRYIPGNEGRIEGMLNRISQLGAKIIDRPSLGPIHASGHAKQDELKELVRITKPHYFLPIHGVHRALVKHKELAVAEGVDSNNCLIALDGETIELTHDHFKAVDQVEINHQFISENSQLMINHDAVRRRNKLAWNGVVVVSTVYDHEHSEFKNNLQISSEGLFGGQTEADILAELKQKLESLLKNQADKNLVDLKKIVKIETRRFYKSNFLIKPEVVVIIHEI